MKRYVLSVFALVVVVLGATTAPAFAYDYPSTNEANQANGFPYVELVSQDVGEVTLRFVNDTNSLAFFEYRIDGQVVSSGTPHPVVTGEFIYPGVSVDSRGVAEPVITEQTFQAEETVEVRLALGGERDWDFDWVSFSVLSRADARAECKQGGWESQGFRNQGQCIRFVNTGKDSRADTDA